MHIHKRQNDTTLMVSDSVLKLLVHNYILSFSPLPDFGGLEYPIYP